MINQGLQISAWTAHLGNHHLFYMAVIDSNGHISFVNSHFFRTFQQIAMPPGDKLFMSLIREDYQSPFLQALSAAAAREDEPMTIAVQMKTGSGRMLSWELRRFDTTNSGLAKFFCLGVDLPTEAGVHPPEKYPAASIAAGKDQQKRLAGSIIRAQHQERARIGRELHDNVNQILTSAQLYAGCLSRESEDFDFIKNKVMETILLAIEEVRSLSHDMVMPDLKGQGLIECVDKLIADLRYNKRLDIAFCHSDRQTIESQDVQLKLTLFRIIQEQTKNILKHSCAKNVEISLHAANDQVRLLVTDNGRGFDPNATTGGLGLSGIRERVELHRGKLTLKTAPGQGCILIVTIPLEVRRII